VCFSPQADVAGGLVICAIGIDAVRHVRHRREFLALAWIPLLIAFVVLPVFVPLAVIALEPTRRRKLMMAPCALTGTVLTISGFAFIWCAWAAISSAAITLRCRLARPDPQPAGTEVDHRRLA
jgi:hypothetical protein